MYGRNLLEHVILVKKKKKNYTNFKFVAAVSNNI